MKLYHGTQPQSVDAIRKKGLEPGSLTGLASWGGILSYDRGCVYLTDSYAGLFAGKPQLQRSAERDLLRAVKGHEWIILEVDTDRLCEELLEVDIDYLVQTQEIASGARLPEEERANVAASIRNDRTAIGRWRESLEAIGNVAYRDVIPTAAITRIARFVPERNHVMALIALSANIDTRCHQIAGPMHRKITGWLMGEHMAVDDFLSPIEALASCKPLYQKIVGREDCGGLQSALDDQCADVKPFNP